MLTILEQVMFLNPSSITITDKIKKLDKFVTCLNILALGLLLLEVTFLYIIFQGFLLTKTNNIILQSSLYSSEYM